jgi:hypothetical protein
MVELTLSHILPFAFGGVEECLHLLLTSLVAVLQQFSKLSFDLSVSLHDDLNVKVIHDIRIVSLKRNAVGSNDNSHDTIDLFSFIIFFI